jgi:hypothetical protein
MNKWERLKDIIETEIDNPRSTLGKVALSFVLSKMSTLDKEEPVLSFYGERVCDECKIVFNTNNKHARYCKLCTSIIGKMKKVERGQ